MAGRDAPSDDDTPVLVYQHGSHRIVRTMTQLRDFWDSAQLRCMRQAIGILDVELARRVPVEQRAIYVWEMEGKPVPDRVRIILSDLWAAQDQIVDRLVEEAELSGTIRTYADDEETKMATDGVLDLATLHRVAAGRAWTQVSDARVVCQRDGVDSDAEFLCRATTLGLGLKQLVPALRVGKATARRWMSGKAPLPPGALAELADLEALARDHQRQLATTPGDPDALWSRVHPEQGPVIGVCRTQHTLNERWSDVAPSDTDIGIELAVHQVCAARAGRDTGRSLAFIDDPR